LQVLLPAAVGTNATYWIVGNCGGAINVDVNASMKVTTDCQIGDFLVSARQNRSPYRDYGSFIIRDVALPATGTLDWTANAYIAASPVTVSLRNLPDNANSPTTQIRRKFKDRWVGAATGESFLRFDLPVNRAVTGVGKVMPELDADMLTQSEVLIRISPSTLGSVSVFDVSRGNSYDLDVSAAAVAKPLTVPIFDTDRSFARWQQTTGTADWTVSYFTATRPGQQPVRWHIIAPHTAGMLRVPALPSAFIKMQALPTDVIKQGPFIVGTSPGGYRQALSVLSIESSPEALVRAQGDRVMTATVQAL
jgi:hypothetical protein